MRLEMPFAAVHESVRKEPAVGLPPLSSSYWPDGMKKAAIQTRMRTKARMVTGAGNPRVRFSPTADGEAFSLSAGPRLSEGLTDPGHHIRRNEYELRDCLGTTEWAKLRDRL
jgi:hypothetical protein